MSSQKHEPREAIAVIGMACRFPHAKDLPSLWRVISTGEVTFEDIDDSRWKHSAFYDPTDVRAVDKTYVRKGAFIDGVDEFAALHYGLAPRRVQVMDPQHRLCIEATRQALQDAGLDHKGFDKQRTGVFIGASVSEYKDLMTARHRAQQAINGEFGDALLPHEAEPLKAAVADVAPARAFTIAGSLLNMIACSVAQTFDLNGPAMSIDAACSSALVAIHEAVVNLRARQVNVALAGGVYLNLNPDNLIGFSRIGAISPSGACRPFDAKADGFVMGEGVGMVVLKRLDDALRDGDRVYAVLRGSGCNNDGRGEGPMTPRPEGQRDAMWRAHTDVDFPVESISYVETHGTATTVGDVVEVGALKHFFNERAGKALEHPFCNLGSIKGNVGHTMSAAGVAGFIKTCLMLHHGVIPPQPGVEELNPKLDLAHSPFVVAREAKPWNVPLRRAAVSSFGFGGTNAHVLLEQAPAPKTVEAHASGPQLLLLSAPTHALLKTHAEEIAHQVKLHGLRVADVARTLASRHAHDCRVAFLASTREELLEKLGQVASGALDPSTPVPAEQRKLGFLFAGQGAQRVGLLQDLVARFPALRSKLEQYDAATKAEFGFSLLAALYPPAGTDPAAAQAFLTRTEICQPAMAALGIALGELLRECNVLPSVTLGHSLGEFAAASVAGMLPGADAVKLVARRGALMNGLQLADAGAMLAVMAERGVVQQHLAGVEGVVVANHNHPTQVVLSGTTKGIEAAQAVMAKAGLKHTRLDVSHAFHSPLMAGMDEKMKAVVAGLALQEPKVAVASCISGRTYHSAAEAREIWVRHATSPVNFVEALQTCVDEGVTHFVQVGAGGALLAFARGVAPSAAMYPLAPNEGQDAGAMFLGALGQLWSRGVPVNALPLLAGASLVTLPPTPLETQKYWAMERTPRAPRPVTRAPLPQAFPTTSAVQQQSLKKGPVAMDNLIALFQQQMALLQSQAEIVKAQAQAIQAMAGGDTTALTAVTQSMQVATASGGAAVAMQSAVIPAPAPVVARPPDFSNLVGKKGVDQVVGVQTAAPVAPAPVVKKEEPKVDLRPEVKARVLEAVARISAFPQATLKLEQTLVGELGFDSLMLVELDQSIGKAFPSLGGLPRELFSKNTTSGTIIEHVVQALEKGPSAKAEAAAVAAPVERYAPAVVPAPLAVLSETVASFSRPVLVTKDARGVAEAIVAKLQAHGVAAQLGDGSTPGEFAGVIDLVGDAADYRAASRDALALSKKLGAEKAELFVAVTSLGGHFGFGGVTRAALGQVGALGFAKALAAEWPDALVKAIDVDAALGADAIAQHVVDEVLSGDRTAEVGFGKHGRTAVSLAPAKAAALKGLDAGSVVVITGGAKGLGFKFAKALAKAHGCTIALTGRSALNEELSKAVAQVKTAGAKACSYHAMNVRDAASVKAAIDAIRAQHGKVDAVVHNAGLLADALVEKKDVAQLDSVLETKVGGALALLDATKGDALSLLVFIGSWAGRFGNAAQTDYSAANEMMARLVSEKRAGLRTLAIDFPPWEDSEMAKKIPAFKKAELKAEGVTFLSDDEGVAAFLAELKGGEGEVLVGRALPERTVRHVAHFPVSRLNHVYLNDHTMAGQRVLPFAAALDHVAAAALEATGAQQPGQFTPFAVTDFKLQRAVIVPDTIWLEASVKQALRGGKAHALDVSLSQGRATSYTGTVTVGADSAVVPAVKSFAATPTLPLSLKDFYGGFTFHGPRLQGIVSIDALGDDGVVGHVKGCRPADWIKEPLRNEWTVDPLVLDASFQLAGYWAWVKQQRAGFPVSLGRFVQLAPFGAGPLKVTVTFESSSDDLFSGTLVWQNEKGQVVAYVTGMTAEFKKRDPQFQTRATPAPMVAEPPVSMASPVVDEPAPAAPVAIDESAWNPEKFPEYEELKERISMAEAFGLQNPYFSVHEAICGDTTVVNGKTMINFSSYNYVGNSGDPVVSKAAQDAIAKYGTSVSASRVASGEKPLTLELERALADFFGTEDCIVLVSGHATNVTVVGHMAGPGDLVLHDALAHDSIIQGAKLSGAKRRPFPHNDWEALDRMLTNLRPHYRRVLIAIEGTYSMDGDIPELPKFIEVKKKHKAMLLVDEAHSAGVVGPTGRGIGEYFDVNRADVDMWMGTLSKSFASCGGYIAGSKALVEYLKYTTPGFVYSVGIPPPNAAAALASTKQMLAHPERSKKAKDNAAYFVKLLKERGINTGMTKDTAVVPAIIGNSVLCLQVSDALKKRGINVQPILYPAVEEDQARLRFFLSSLHQESQLLHTANVLKEELERLTREMNGDAVA
ncbi:MAG: aminotransferase class I/II-fold pyridoxal phosphate-dependent enzyme [Myxococcota bacterium]